MSEVIKSCFEFPFSLPGNLEKWTLGYLGLPLLFFFFGQFTLGVFLIVGSLAAICLFSFFAKNPEVQAGCEVGPQLTDAQKKWWWIQGIILAIWVALSGSGHFFMVNGDYYKHNAILVELTTRTWPVFFTAPNGQGVGLYLHYYFGNYIIPAFIGKWLGLGVGFRVVYFWNLLGVILSFAWVARVLARNPWWILPFVIFFSGADALGMILFGKGLPPLGDHLEWWNGINQYSSHLTQLWWVPQHALPSWILISYFFDQILNKRSPKQAILFFSLSAFWSPFAMFGLTPYLALYFLFHFKDRRWISGENLLGIVILAIMASFYFSGALQHRQSWFWDVVTEGTWVKWAEFLLIEIGPWAIVGLPLLKLGTLREKFLFIITVASLCVIPAWIFGMYNDWCMRTSIVGIFALCLLSAKSLLSFSPGTPKKVIASLMLIFFLVGSVTGISELVRTFNGPINPQAFVGGVDQLPMEIVTAQYVGVPDGPFYKYLVRAPEGNGVNLRKGVWTYLREHHLPLWDDFFRSMPE